MRRPPVLWDPIPDDILNVVPRRQFVLDPEEFAHNVRSAKRGAAGGPSGMTAEHLRLILESEGDTGALCRATQDLARAEVPPDVLAPNGVVVVSVELCAEILFEDWSHEPLHSKSRPQCRTPLLRSSMHWRRKREESVWPTRFHPSPIWIVWRLC